ncbi:MAG: hypothetical protein A2X47_10485 [Lentisphaerae bacterium GWF2_38_69]|nr:MAG: hypothetical protein A2X47_10485 [Lentisphaerae bacterium GWF2_38_69]
MRKPDLIANTYPLNAVLLLSEHDEASSIETILALLRQGHDFLKLYFGETWSDTAQYIIYKYGMNHLDKLKAFMLEESIYPLAKCTISDALTRKAHDKPSYSEAVRKWHDEVLEFYYEHINNNKLIDSNLITELLGNIPDFDNSIADSELAMKLFEVKDLINEHIYGTYDEWKEYCLHECPNEFEPMPKNISALLRELHDRYFISQEQQELFSSLIPKQRLVDEKIVGRNDPCPCGSGKKYKKCCLK